LQCFFHPFLHAGEFMKTYAWPPRPLDEDEDDPNRTVVCCQCEILLEDEACHNQATDEYYCAECADLYVKESAEIAREHAIDSCKITRALPAFDTDDQFKPTPDEYAAGDKMSNTPNAYLTICRHHYTNYDQLLSELDRDNTADMICACEIRNQIMKLIITEVQDKELGNIGDDFDGYLYPQHAPSVMLT
jgi:hypothetical protein